MRLVNKVQQQICDHRPLSADYRSFLKWWITVSFRDDEIDDDGLDTVDNDMGDDYEKDGLDIARNLGDDLKGKDDGDIDNAGEVGTRRKRNIHGGICKGGLCSYKGARLYKGDLHNDKGDLIIKQLQGWTTQLQGWLRQLWGWPFLRRM